MAFQIMAPGVPGGPIIFVDGVAFSPATAAYQAPVAGGVLTAPSPAPPVVRWSTNSPSAAAFAGASGPATVPPAITGPYLGPPSLAAANAPFTTVIVTCCVTWASAAPFALIPNIAGAPNVAGPSGVIVPMAQGVVPGIATLAVPSIVLAVSNTNGIAGNFSASVIYRTAR